MWLGATIIRHETCASTNDVASDLASQGANHGTVVVADAQSCGRGRQGRSWHSPPGLNLYMSCLLRPELPPRDTPPLTLVAGIALVEAVSEFGVSAAIKWPNDVRVRGRKLAGVLTETKTRGALLDHVIVGMGVNINQTDFPPPLADTATSMCGETGALIDREHFLDALLARFEAVFDNYVGGGVGAISSAFASHLEPGRVTAIVAGMRVEGRVRGIDDAGALRVIDDTGREHCVRSGDVEVVA